MSTLNKTTDLKSIGQFIDADYEEYFWVYRELDIDKAAFEKAKKLPDAFSTLYLKLRFEAQEDYAKYRVSGADGFGGFRTIEKGLTSAALVCALGIFAVHLVIAGAGIGRIDHFPYQSLHIATICIAIVALALRAVEEGLQPSRELERYERYEADTRWLKSRFRNAATGPRQINLMLDMERLSFAEMTGFMRDQIRARFIL